MIDVVNTPEGNTPVRVIKTTPRERWEGHWERGRKYPLYSIVENNGSIFISVTGKMKDEPYVVYDDETGMFCANDGWLVKEMSADSRLTAIGNKGVAGLASVTASVDGVGTEVFVQYGGPAGAKTLDFAFYGLKGSRGVSIANIVQTLVAATDGSDNEITVTLEDGSSSKFYVKNGSPSVETVSATVDSIPGTPSVHANLNASNKHLSFAFYGLKGVQGNPGVNNTEMRITEDIEDETASADTMDIVFLMYNEDTGEYDRYITQFDGEEYEFVQVGDTSLDLDEYKRVDSEVWLTQAEFDALAIKDITKTYYVYEETEEPE